MFRAVERHVFEKVRQSVLVVLLQNGADSLRNVKFGALFRLLVVANVVGQTIVESP